MKTLLLFFLVFFSFVYGAKKENKKAVSQKDIKKKVEKISKRNKDAKKKIVFDIPKKDRERLNYIKDTLKYGTPREIIISLYNKDFILRYYNELLSLLVSMYKDRNEVDVQAKIVDVLSYIWDKEEDSKNMFNICEVLEIGKDKKMHDISLRIKKRIAFLIGKYACKDRIWILEQIIETEGIKINNNLVLIAINSIAKIGTKEGGIFLSNLLKKSGDYMNKTIKANLILAIGKCGYKEAINIIVDIFKNKREDIYVRAYSANAIGKLFGVKYKKLLIDELNRINQKGIYEREKSKVLYYHILYALMKLGDKDVKRFLIEGIRSQNPKIRALSIHLLGELKDSSCKDILLYRAKYDENVAVKLEAIKSLGNICPLNIQITLDKLLKKVRSARLKVAIREAIHKCSSEK